MYEALWFFAGVLGFQVLSTVFGYSQLAVFAQEFIVSCLSLLVKLHEDVAFIQQLKHNILEDSDIPKEKIKLIQDTDERSLRNWRTSVITHFLTAFPGTFRGLIKFNTWKQALAYLQDKRDHR